MNPHEITYNKLGKKPNEQNTSQKLFMEAARLEKVEQNLTGAIWGTVFLIALALCALGVHWGFGIVAAHLGGK